MYWNKDSLNQQTVNEDTQIMDESYEESMDDAEPMDINKLVEAFIVDSISRMPDEQRKAFLESNDFRYLVESGVISEAGRSITRLNREDDLTRRMNVAALELARQSNDAMYDQWKQMRSRERALRDKLYRKYAMKSKKLATQAQKRILKINPQIFNTLRAIR